ncbi:hypothetical protein U1Q18_031573 [Sarracenia purpurea var. burkii]
MGRAKLSMELIGNEKARYLTFQKRKKGLKKKTYELKTLCGVEVCLIVYGPKTDNDQYSAEPELWPPNREEVEGLIESYKKQSAEDRKRRSIDLSNFFEDRSRKVEDELVKLRNKNHEARYPTWDDRYNDFSEDELREFVAILEMKLQNVKAGVELIKGNLRLAAPPSLMNSSHTESTPNHSNFMQGMLRRNNMHFEAIHGDSYSPQLNSHDHLNFPIYHPFEQTHHGLHHVDGGSVPNPMLTMMMMNDNHHQPHQLGGGPGCSVGSAINFLYNPLDRQIYYDPLMCGVMENKVVENARPLAGYYGSVVQPLPSYLPFPVVASSGSAQVHASQMEDYYGLREYHMKYQK